MDNTVLPHCPTPLNATPIFSSLHHAASLHTFGQLLDVYCSCTWGLISQATSCFIGLLELSTYCILHQLYTANHHCILPKPMKKDLYEPQSLLASYKPSMQNQGVPPLTPMSNYILLLSHDVIPQLAHTLPIVPPMPVNACLANSHPHNTSHIPIPPDYL